MFVNFSNHNSKMWGQKQLEAASKFGDIVDVPFPYVSGEEDEVVIERKVDDAVTQILSLSPDVVMCQGEFTLSYGVIRRLRDEEIHVVAACSERVSEEYLDEQGRSNKKVIFHFMRFRDYE